MTEEEAFAFAEIGLNLPKGVLNWEHRAIRFGPFCGVLRDMMSWSNCFRRLMPDMTRMRMRGACWSAWCGRLVKSARQKPAMLCWVSRKGIFSTYLFLISVPRFGLRCSAGPFFAMRNALRTCPLLRGRLQLTEHLRRMYSTNRNYTAVSTNGWWTTLSIVLSRRFCACFLRTVSGRMRNPRLPHCSIGLMKFHHPGAAADIDGLIFDRTNEHWCPVFRCRPNGWIGERLVPESASWFSFRASSLIFNMERLFEEASAAV